MELLSENQHTLPCLLQLYQVLLSTKYFESDESAYNRLVEAEMAREEGGKHGSRRMERERGGEGGGM